jgi:hypothetical protein
MAIAVRFCRRGAGAISSVSAIGVALAGSIGGGVILFCDRFSWPTRNADFARSGSFLLWAFVIVVQAAIWPLAVAWIWPDLRTLRSHWKTNRKEIRESVFLLTFATWTAFALAAAVPAFPNYLPHHEAKLVLLSTVGWVAGTVAAIGIWLVHGALKDMLKRAPKVGDLAELLVLREQLQRFLFVSGSIIGLALLGAGAERNMITAFVAHTKEPSGFPIEFVLVYGFFFSAVLALVYFPTHLTMLETASRIRDHFVPLPPITNPKWTEAVSKRTTLETVLAMNVGANASFRAGLSILTPLLASLTGLLLNAK